MKICIHCSIPFDSTAWECPHCLTTAKIIDNYYSLLPALAAENFSFPSEYYAELAAAEPNHFWFQARKELILWAIKEYFAQHDSFLEIGCGTGYILNNIVERYENMQIYGSELYGPILSEVTKSKDNTTLFQMDARNIPFENEFDLIGAFDVLEHIQEDITVLKQIHKALKINGGVLMTVPQHPWLWSKTDEYLQHFRRYTAGDIKNKLNTAGFRIKRSTSFISLLLPLMIASRCLQKKDYKPSQELKINSSLNSLLQMIFRMEFMLIKRGINFPAGGSLFIVAEKTL